MQTREQLQERIAELEKQLAQVRKFGVRALRRRARFEIANLPLYDIALGPDLAQGELRGHARGIIAIGDIATGIVAIGAIARGAIALGGLAIGALAAGGGALGGVAVGGAAAGYYACGGAALGEHVIAGNRPDPQADVFFRSYGLYGCGEHHRRRY